MRLLSSTAFTVAAVLPQEGEGPCLPWAPTVPWVHGFPPPLSNRPCMPNLVPPKIPDGEGVDFDVSAPAGRAGPGWQWLLRPGGDLGGPAGVG